MPEPRSVPEPGSVPAPHGEPEPRSARRRAQEAAVAPDTPRARAARDPLEPLPPLGPEEVPYVELHLHSCFSLLEGASRVEELVQAAVAQGHRALALTDHDGMYGAMEFARAAKAAGLHPITGLELTIAEPDGSRSHLTLLAETREGYANLCRLSSRAFGLHEPTAGGREQRRLDPVVPREALAAHARGLILLTGCTQGRLATLLTAGQQAAAAETLRRYIEWFGAEQVFVELQEHLVRGERARNRALAALAAEAGVGVVGTGNVHYHEPDRHRLQDVLVAIRHRKTLETSHRERRPNGEFYLRSPREQAERFARSHAEAARNSVRIARRCRFDLTQDLGYRLPAPPVPGGRTPQQELERICRERLAARYAGSPPGERAAAEQRLELELGRIAGNGLGGFFLVYHDIMQLAEEVARDIRGTSVARQIAHLPPGRGRGSSVASIVCYLIGLSHIDPIRARLPIDRFLTEEMHTFPDIDIDFARDIRAELIERVHARWGADHAALVAIFPTYRMRSAVRDIGKALGLPESELGRIAKGAHPYHRASEVAGELARSSALGARAAAPGWRDLGELAAQLAGFPRHLSQHVGGMVISSDPLIDCVPCQPAAWEGRYLCHWDKDSVDDARMVKIDFLGLGMLSAVEETVERIAEQGHPVPDLSRIPLDDQALFDQICRGDTVGVFQIESRAQIAMLPRTQPRTLDDLTVQVSIVRPGPIVGGAVNPYVRERERQRRLGAAYRPPAVHPTVDDVLADTLGVVLFQEQVVQVARQMGGFSAGRAEQFRRAMSRKRSLSEMAGHEQAFMEGARARGVPPATARRVFDNLLGFAEFGFPRSHGAAFGLLAYQTVWLRHYHPAPFYCALFNNQPMGFYPPHVLTNDAQRHGVPVLRPEVNASRARCTVEDPRPGTAAAMPRGRADAAPVGAAAAPPRKLPGAAAGAVRVGLGYVRGVGAAGAELIERERERGGPFRSLFDFVQRTGLPRRATEALCEVGAFDELAHGLNRRELLWQLGLFSDGMQRSVLRAPRERQLRLPLPTEQDQVALRDQTAYERMAIDYALLRLSPDSHPMQHLRPALGEGVVSARHVGALPAGQRVEVAGLVVCRQQPLTARGIIFLLLEDEFGLTNVLVSNELVERERDTVRTAMFVVAGGVLERPTGQQRTLVADSIRELVPRDALAMPSGKSWA